MLIRLPTGSVELTVPRAVHAPSPSSVALARLIDVRPGETVLDLGCGAGILAIAAARLGARRVVAVDVDPEALRATRENARRHGVTDRVVTREGSWLEAAAGEGPFAVIMATPPQTPGPRPFGPRYGGWDGADHLVHIAGAARDHLERRRGRLWMLALSLANPERLRRALEENYRDIRIVHKTDREFSAAEYDSRLPGLMDHLQALREAGMAIFHPTEGGGWVFQNLFYRAARPRGASARPRAWAAVG
ncbi:MAG: 50S ribosomal protein L11 methyltransferase [Pseudomonadota bacterium]|nr:50S ribosomal protein L11 methyltransferase [Pseudomonadota bacterium]